LNSDLESTVLTAISLSFGDFAGSIGDAGIHSSVLHGSFEETFAAFACYDSIVKTCCFVFADHADKRLVVFIVIHVF
jgi:hypothetical protein